MQGVTVTLEVTSYIIPLCMELPVYGANVTLKELQVLPFFAITDIRNYTYLYDKTVFKMVNW